MSIDFLIKIIFVIILIFGLYLNLNISSETFEIKSDKFSNNLEELKPGYS